jgi:hypothetical protein
MPPHEKPLFRAEYLHALEGRDTPGHRPALIRGDRLGAGARAERQKRGRPTEYYCDLSSNVHSFSFHMCIWRKTTRPAGRGVSDDRTNQCRSAAQGRGQTLV